TTLHAAVLAGSKPVAELLISNGADVNARDTEGVSVLFYATGKGYSEIVDLLIANGANPDKVLWGAILGGHNDIAERLLSAGADVQSVGDSGALHVAALKNNLDGARLLIRHGVPVDARWLGRTPLHYAITDGRTEFCQLMIEQGADVNARNKWNWTPLHTACEHNYSDKVEILLANGADVKARNEDGNTPLAVARAAGHAELVTLLRKHGANE
ncbi:MAG: ankyrin repeat domain-containing protein, partial [Phycisphaerales bacterium]